MTVEQWENLKTGQTVRSLRTHREYTVGIDRDGVVSVIWDFELHPIHSPEAWAVS